MPEQNSAAQSRDRRRVNALANSMQRALAGIDLMLHGMTEREKLVVLHLALDRQLQIDRGMRDAQGATTATHTALGFTGGGIARAALDRSGRHGTAPPA